MFFANLSNSSAYSPIPATPPPIPLTPQSLQIIVPAESTPTLPTYSSLDKWTASGSYSKISAVSASGSQTIQSKVNNDHQTFNFEKINFPSETVIEKIELIATAKKAGPQTTKMSLTFAKGTTLSDLPLGGTPMTTSFVDYTRDVTNHPGTTTPLSLTEIGTWQVGGTGLPITFGVAQNTDGKTVLVDKSVLKIRFQDHTPPDTTVGTCDDEGNNGWCIGGLTETLTATDPQPGAGVKEIRYTLSPGGTETTVPAVGLVSVLETEIAITETGIYSLEYYAIDNVGNEEAPTTLSDIKFDDDKPVSSAEINDAAPTGGSYAPGAVVTLSCTDVGSGVDKIEYKLNDDTDYTTYDIGITVSQPGANTILYRCIDVAGNTETPDNLLTVTIQAATISIDTPVDPASTKWKEEFIIGGDTTDTISGDSVSVDWDDGTTTTGLVIAADGTWGATHAYGPDNVGVKEITATVVNGGNAVSAPATKLVTIEKRNTVISLEDVVDPSQGGNIFVRGNLRDQDTSGVLPGAIISFDNDPVITIDGIVPLVSTETGEIKIEDNLGISPAICDGTSDDSIIVNEGAQITVPGKPTTVNIGLCDTASTFDYLVTDGTGFTSTQSSSFNPQSSDGITTITISNLSGTAEITSLEGTNAGGQQLFAIGFSSVTLEDDGSLISNDGIFATKGTAPDEDGLEGTIGVSFGGNDNYNPASAVYDGYTIQYSPGGIGNNVAIISDVGDLVSYDTGTDTDKDGVLDAWESDGADEDTELDGIPYACSAVTCYLKLQDLPGAGVGGPPAVGTDDVYLEVDGFALHVNSAAVADVAAKFAETHPGAAQPTKLHYIISDTGITEATTVTLWRDAEASNNRGNDFDSLKADWFAEAADRATLNSGSQNNNRVDNDSVSFSGLNLTTPGGGVYSSDNIVYGTIILKMKINFNAAPTSLSQSTASCDGEDLSVNITDANITSTFSNGATTSQKIITTKVKFSTTGQVTNVSIGTCQVNLAIGGAIINSSGGTATENVSPVIFTEKQIAKFKVFRYIFMSHSIGGPSGRAELWSNDAITALSAYTQVGGHGVGSQDEQAGTIMHELGHLLNLDHGGARWLQPTDEVNPIVLGQSLINCKPNYISVMPYHRQLPGTYLNQASVGGAGGWKLGYSSGLLGNLNELNLDERNGLVSSDSYFTNAPVTITQGAIIVTATFANSGAAGLDVNTELTGFVLTPRLVWATPGVSPGYKGGINKITLGGSGSPPVLGVPANAIDISWDGDANAAENFVNIRKDINNYGIYGCGASTNTILSDGNDWAHLDYRMGLNPTGLFGDGDSVYEINSEQLQQIELASANYIIIPPPAIDGTEIRNAGSQLPIKIDLQRQDGTDITYATLRAEFYTTDPHNPTIIGSGEYSSVIGHYAIPWKTPKNPTGVYHINVYIENPIPSEEDRHLVDPISPLLDTVNTVPENEELLPYVVINDIRYYPITIRVTLN